jgi:hypothetical protein
MGVCLWPSVDNVLCDNRSIAPMKPDFKTGMLSKLLVATTDQPDQLRHRAGLACRSKTRAISGRRTRILAADWQRKNPPRKEARSPRPERRSCHRISRLEIWIVRSGDLPHPSARHCLLVSIGRGPIGGRRRPSQRAGLRDQFGGREQLRHIRRINPRTALMRQRRPLQGRHDRNQCASGAGGNAADVGNRHRKIQGPLFASTEITYAGDAKFHGAPRRRPSPS